MDFNTGSRRPPDNGDTIRGRITGNRASSTVNVSRQSVLRDEGNQHNSIIDKLAAIQLTLVDQAREFERHRRRAEEIHEKTVEEVQSQQFGAEEKINGIIGVLEYFSSDIKALRAEFQRSQATWESSGQNANVLEVKNEIAELKKEIMGMKALLRTRQGSTAFENETSQIQRQAMRLASTPRPSKPKGHMISGSVSTTKRPRGRPRKYCLHCRAGTLNNGAEYCDQCLQAGRASSLVPKRARSPEELTSIEVASHKRQRSSESDDSFDVNAEDDASSDGYDEHDADTVQRGDAIRSKPVAPMTTQPNVRGSAIFTIGATQNKTPMPSTLTNPVIQSGNITSPDVVTAPVSPPRNAESQKIPVRPFVSAPFAEDDEPRRTTVSGTNGGVSLGVVPVTIAAETQQKVALEAPQIQSSVEVGGRSTASVSALSGQRPQSFRPINGNTPQPAVQTNRTIPVVAPAVNMVKTALDTASVKDSKTHKVRKPVSNPEPDGYDVDQKHKDVMKKVLGGRDYKGVRRKIW